MSDSIVRTPWKDYMGEVPMHLEYFDGSMFEAVENVAKKYPNSIAFTFMGKSTRSEERRVGKECRSRWSPYH